MKMKFCFVRDLFKCAKIAFYIAVGVAIFATIIFCIFYDKHHMNLFGYIKNCLYYTGCFGFLVSVGFFVQKNATRPLVYQNEWRKIFYRLNLGFVIMFIGLMICMVGMLIQLITES
jgi:hypothetical protein